ncbi:MAG: type I DNA topoisomerase [Phycisphaera sp.]|nr:type I DNA topoisomerase [Phycisphaera sp.]
MAKKVSSKSKKALSPTAGEGRGIPLPEAGGKHLVIVESPTKAKTINKYLGKDYVVMASVGHVRDLPSRNPKGVKAPVPGVDLEHDFAPTYQVMPDKQKTITALKKAAKSASDVWFATDLDREGEAIAWHLAQTLGVETTQAKRVVFNAITKSEITQAFSHPRNIDQAKVDAQQARRILDRIVGYQVSPLLWKKVAGGLSAGRVQSVAVRLVVEREREIEAFIPTEYWKVTGSFATELAKAPELAKAFAAYLADVDEGKTRSIRERVTWLSDHKSLRAELVEVDGQAVSIDNRDDALKLAQALGYSLEKTDEKQDEKGKGPARFLCVYLGSIGKHAPQYRVKSIETRRTSTRPSAPFITSTLQQAASNQLGFPLQRTMRIAQQLYEGIDIKGVEGQTGLITYMRTDSTHLSPEALRMARDYVGKEWGEKYLPDKPNYYTSSNKNAQEAHEAIRPTDVTITPKRVRNNLTEEQYKLYRLIWERFLGSQMVPAQWDSTAVLIETQGVGVPSATFKATGRTLVFDGFYKAVGLPGASGGDDAVLPPLTEKQPLAPIHLDPTQHFTSPPPRYTEASLQKKLEEEGIGRPSTYAAIISTIQDRKYVQPLLPRDRRLCATDLGKVVTDKLVEGFPTIMDVAYTRNMEATLDKIEDEHLDWVHMLREFYGPFKENLERAHEEMSHAKAEMEPAPYDCAKCGAPTVYRFGKNGRFLSCSRYPDCDYAAPIDREGKPMVPQATDIACPVCGSAMTKRTGRFGPFLSCMNYPKCNGIVKLDPKKQTVILPKVPPLVVDVPCPKCSSPLNVRESKRGLWLSCSTFPKCRGRAAFNGLEEKKQKEIESAWSKHVKENPAPIIRTTTGKVVPEGHLPEITGEPVPDADAA